MDAPARPARLPLGRTVVVSGLVVALLAVAVRVQAVDGGSVAGAGSGSPVTDRTTGQPAVDSAANRPLPAAAAEAIDQLAATSHRIDGAAHAHVGGHLFGPAEEVELTTDDAGVFAGQWAAAQAAVPALDTIAEAAAAGYVLSSSRAPGVGVHWVNWELIARPFDPARPAMLLFTAARGGDRLAGFSYWVQSADEPAGFTGPNDHWHTHSGLCVVDGAVVREGVATPAECPGRWLAGDDLWMLHAWLVDHYPNRWGRFAQTNPTLCPVGGADLASCTPDEG